MTTAHVRVQSINPGAGSDEAKLADLQGYVDRGATFILGQEFGDRPDLVAMFLEANPHWRVLWETATNDGRKTPIFYDRHQAGLVWWNLLIVWMGGYLGPKGAGPDTGATKRLNRARFKLKNGVRVKVLNLHATVSAFSTTGAEGTRRRIAWLTQLKAFFKEVKRTRSRVVVIGGGDLNADTANRYLVESTPGSWSWDSSGPTLRQDTPDHIGHRRAANVRVHDSGVDETDGSQRQKPDHRSPWVTYTISA